jgi:hypothetical protein
VKIAFFVILIAWHLCGSVGLWKIILSLCFDKWEKYTTFATVKVVKIGCTRCKTLKQVLRFTRWHNLCKRKGLRILVAYNLYAMNKAEHERVFLILFDKYMGKSYTASSLRILQGLTAAKVVGCSGAM